MSDKGSATAIPPWPRVLKAAGAITEALGVAIAITEAAMADAGAGDEA